MHEKYTKAEYDLYCYCFDLGYDETAFDNFLEVEVCNGIVIGWITNRPEFGRKGKTVYTRGKTKSGTYLTNLCRMDEGSKQWLPQYEAGTCLVGEVQMKRPEGGYYHFEEDNTILSEEQRDACYTTNALRALAGLEPFKLDKYLGGRLWSAGAGGHAGYEPETDAL